MGGDERGNMKSWRPYAIVVMTLIAGSGLWRVSVGASSDPRSEDPWGAWDAVVIIAGLLAIGGIIFVLARGRRRTGSKPLVPAPRGTFDDRASRFGRTTAIRWRRWQAIGWASAAVFELAVVCGVLAVIFRANGNQAGFNVGMWAFVLGIIIGLIGLLCARRFGRYAIAGELLAQLRRTDPRLTLPMALAMLHKPVLYDRWVTKFGDA